MNVRQIIARPIFNKSAMQNSIVRATHVSQNNIMANEALLYNNKADYMTILLRYLGTKFKAVLKKV